MRSYLLTSGVIFFLIVVAHAARLVVEGTRPATEPSFLAATALAIGMCVWACVLLRRNVS
jgi:hypothetical protein